MPDRSTRDATRHGSGPLPVRGVLDSNAMADRIDEVPPPTRHVTTTRIIAVRGDGLEVRADRVVGEEPLEIRAAGPNQEPVAVAVTMRTPG